MEETGNGFVSGDLSIILVSICVKLNVKVLVIILAIRQKDGDL